MVIPPSYRFDVHREVDIAEEIGRLKGYWKVPEDLPRLTPQPLSREGEVEERLKALMVGYGFYEAITYSFISPRTASPFGMGDGLRLLNPLSEEQSLMRTSLIPGLVEVARFNASRGIRDLRVFELKKVFLPQGEELPKEEKRLAALAMGDLYPRWWRGKGEPVDFFAVKGWVEGILEELGVEEVRFTPPEGLPYLHPGQGAWVEVKGNKAGVLGRLSPEVEEAFELEGVYVFELYLEEILPAVTLVKAYKPLPKFPGTYRDVAFLVDEEFQVEEVLKLVRGLKLPYLEGVEVLDCYSGPPLPEGKKNLALRLYFRAEDRTLTDEEANEGQRKVIEVLTGAGLRLRG